MPYSSYRRLYAMLRTLFYFLTGVAVVAAGWSAWSIFFAAGDGLASRSLWFGPLVIAPTELHPLSLLDKLLPVVYAGLAFVAAQLGSLFQNFSKGNVLTMANVSKVRFVGLGFLMVSLYQVLSSWLSARSIVGYLVSSGVEASVAPIRVGFLVPTILIFAAAELVKLAVVSAGRNGQDA